jgi:hypothetical protein
VKVVLCRGDHPVDDIALALKHAGHEVRVVAVYPHGSHEPIDGIEIESFTDPRGGATLGMLRRVAVAIASLAPFLRRAIVHRGIEAASRAAGDYVARRARYFETERPDVVCFNSPDPAAIPLARLAHDAGCAIVYHEQIAAPGRRGFEHEYAEFAESVIPLCDVVYDAHSLPVELLEQAAARRRHD